MIGFLDLAAAVGELGIDTARPVIAHASLSAFGEVEGGAETVLEALLSSFETLVMPAFTYKTMIIPEVGPQHNAMIYGSGRDVNLMAEFYTPGMPVDRTIGIIPEKLRSHPKAQRSMHPILSFVGVNADRVLASQNMAEPLNPIRSLIDAQAWCLLLGVDYTVNTSIHYAEQMAGRKQFIRWALTPHRIVQCPKFPGCSTGFNLIAPRVEHMTQRVQIGDAQVQALPLYDMIQITRNWIEVDPLALLCSRSRCERCEAVRVDNRAPVS